MIKNISKIIKSLLILSLCCSITFQSTLVIGNAEQLIINNENEISDNTTNSQVEENTNESIVNPEEELDEPTEDSSTNIEGETESSENLEETIEEDTDDSIVEIIEEDPGRPNMGGSSGRVLSISDIEIVNLKNPNAIGSGKVIDADTLNVRSGPSTSYEKIGTLKGNEAVEILGTSASWYKIDFKGKEGYISAAYLALSPLDKGIDVSKWNGDIDWKSVKNAGISYAIIRAGYGTKTVDPKFEANIKGALNAGVKVGVYWFSYATSVEGAQKEAEKCLQTLAPYKGKLAYPVFFDYEYASVDNATEQGITITKDLATNMAKAFLNKVKSNGYLTGLYTNTDFSGRYFHEELLYSNHIWHAQYSSKNTFKKPYSMWQYTDKGSVPGIKGAVDLNHTTLKTFDIGDTPTVPTPDPSKEIGITTTNLNLTVGPYSNATVVSGINKGSSVEILDKGISGWYYIEYNGKRGYLPSQYVSIGGLVSETGVAKTNLSLTVGPFTYATVISSVNRGDSFEILDKGLPGWYYVHYKGQRGYIPSQCVSINGTSSEVGITIANLNLTVGPFADATVVSYIKTGTAVNIIDKEISGWYYVEYNGKRGYLPSKYVSQSEIGVAAGNTQLTAGPFTTATVITSVPKDSTIEILDRGISGWYYAQYNNQRGYIPTKHVK